MQTTMATFLVSFLCLGTCCYLIPINLHGFEGDPFGFQIIENGYPKAISDGNEGCPHLVKVARQGTTALVDFLLERGADIEATDR